MAPNGATQKQNNIAFDKLFWARWNAEEKQWEWKKQVGGFYLRKGFQPGLQGRQAGAARALNSIDQWLSD